MKNTGTNSKYKYKQLAASIEKRIEDGEFLPGQPIPSIRKLMASEGLSLTSVCKGIALLGKKGLLERYPNHRGYFVVHRGNEDNNIFQNATEKLIQEAHSRIIKLLLNGSLSKSQKIEHDKLAEHLGISRSAVDIAIKRLNEEGVLENHGTEASKPIPVDADTMWNIIQWRIALECQAARLASEWMTPKQKEELMEAAKLIDQHIAGAPKGQYTEEDVKFHCLIGTMSGATRIRSELDKLDIYFAKRAMCEVVSAAKVPMSTPPPPNHTELVKQICSGDPLAADKAMRDHLEKSKQIFGFVQWYRNKHKEEMEMSLE